MKIFGLSRDALDRGRASRGRMHYKLRDGCDWWGGLALRSGA